MKNRKTSEIRTDSTAYTVRWERREEISKLVNGLKTIYFLFLFLLLTHTELRSAHMLSFFLIFCTNTGNKVSLNTDEPTFHIIQTKVQIVNV
jgi:hypothetical protein